MRPHVELIHADDYIWHEAELPGGEGRARERRLAIDEEDGSGSLIVEFLSDWGRAGGLHHADTEYFVIEGELEIGGRTLGSGGYVQVPRGLAVPYMKAKEGTRILHWREYGDPGFDATDTSWDNLQEDTLTVVDSEAEEWISSPISGPVTPLYIKLLHRNKETGFYTRLVWAPPGWTDHRLAHHPCYEEAYTLAGAMTYNFGDLDTDTYFFRPAYVKHGHFVSAEPDGCTWIIRSDGELINWYTTNEWIKWGGDAENYDKEKEPPVLSTMPVRSRSRGRWSGDGM